MNEKQRRQFYRLRYPHNARPRILIGQHNDSEVKEVCELSEQGMRIVLNDQEKLPVGYRFSGIVPFPDGETLEVEGEALRESGNEIVIKLTKGPCFKRMWAEQIRIRRKYPWFRG